MPKCPVRDKDMRITKGGFEVCNSWYEIDEECLSKNLFFQQEKEVGTLVEDLPPYEAFIRCIMEREHRETGIPYSRMWLGGNGKGGSMAAYIGLNMPREKKIGGILNIGGHRLFPNSGTFQLAEHNRDVPVLLSNDPMHLQNGRVWGLARSVGSDPWGPYYENAVDYLRFERNTDDPLDVLRPGEQPIEYGYCLPKFESYLVPDILTRIAFKNPDEQSLEEVQDTLYRAGLHRRAKNCKTREEMLDFYRAFLLDEIDGP
eukprot:CAMPEP_0116829362 /NCGR_PEP_ID=MMETSP0418-20121206/4171_1 /TAXON_ID=1158023 /ORGANISM="Astrosyne radiata, Strain 13vi08-1A" /LENGTH=258 /DNA_ID=CAMNT_0004458357 /DNA_START=74 /DNA_END=850 /DNA_ORIENTATION=-